MEYVNSDAEPSMSRLSRRLHRFSIMQAMLLVAAGPLLMIVAVTAWLVSAQINHANKQRQMSDMIELSTIMSALVHELQKERGITILFLTSSSRSLDALLLKQRTLTDQKRISAIDSTNPMIAWTKTRKTDIISIEFAETLRGIVAELSKLGAVRKKVDELELSKEEALVFFNDLDGQILRAIKDISNLSTDPKATASIISFAGFLQSKERAGIERAFGASALATGEFPAGTTAQFIGLIREQDVLMSIFLAEANAAQEAALAEVMRSPAMLEVQEMRDAMFNLASGDGRVDFSPVDFFEAQSARIDLLKGVEEMVVNDLLQSTEQRRADAQRQAVIAVVIALLVISGSLAITIFLARQVRTSMKLVSQAATKMAAGDLKGDIPDATTTELGQISGALDAFRQSIVKARARDKEQTTELKRSNMELEKFAYVAAHDLRSPLRGIQDLATWIQEDDDTRLSEDSQESMDLLMTLVERLNRLLSDLLAYSRTGHDGKEAEIVSLDTTVAEINNLLNPHEKHKISYNGLAKPVTTHALPLRQILLNLISNAIKHNDRETSEIDVSAEANDNWIVVSVADNGPGIDPKYQERIFELFQTLKSRDEVEGSGMGLAIVRKMAEHFAGSVNVQSNPEAGRGTTFKFKLPLSC